MATETQTPGAGVATAAALAISPDPDLARIIEKHARGEKLQPTEYGRLGAWKARVKGAPMGRPTTKPAPGPAPALVAPGPVTPGQAQPTPGGLPGAPAIDPDLVRRTTESILKTCDGIARTWIANEARKAGADDTTARTFESAAALQSGPKDLMVQTSPEVLASLGVDSSNYPVAAFLTGLSIWSGSLLMAVGQLRSMQEQRKAKEAKAAAPAPAPAAPTPAAMP